MNGGRVRGGRYLNRYLGWLVGGGYIEYVCAVPLCGCLQSRSAAALAIRLAPTST